MGLVYRVNKEKVASRTINAEAVLLNLENGFYYSLNKTGSEIWGFIEEGKGSQDIVEFLATKHGIDKKKAEKDFFTLIKDLEKEGLICKKC